VQSSLAHIHTVQGSTTTQSSIMCGGSLNSSKYSQRSTVDIDRAVRTPGNVEEQVGGRCVVRDMGGVTQTKLLYHQQTYEPQVLFRGHGAGASTSYAGSTSTTGETAPSVSYRGSEVSIFMSRQPSMQVCALAHRT
jgi:hypothetical protein